MPTLTLTRTELLSGLHIARDFAERRTTIPILKNCRVTAQGAVATIQTTDLDWLCQQEVPCKIEEAEKIDFTISVSLLDRVARGGDGDLQIELLEDGGLRMSCGDLEMTAPKDLCMPVADWPGMLSEGIDQKIDSTMASAGDLLHLLERLRPAISTEETRYYLNGCYPHRDGDEFLTTTATDGHRMVIHRSPIPWPDHKAILPREFARRLERHLRSRDPDSVVDIWLIPPAGMRLGIRFGSTTLITKCIDGTYPDYRRVVPSHSGELRVRIPTRSLRGFPATSKRYSTLLAVYPNDGFLQHRSDDMAVFKAPIPSSKCPSFGLNLRYLRAFLPRSGEVEIVLGNAGDPMLVLVPGQERTTRVIMPMRI